MDKAVLFDLDGTLLPIDINFFLERYIEALCPWFEPLMPRDSFVRALLTATQAMVDDTDPGSLNQQVFAREFEKLAGYPWDVVRPIFDGFYREVFPGLRRFAIPSRTARRVVEQCLRLGFRIVLATNAIFPEVAVRERMRWCGVEDLPWEFVTTFENMHFCKPHVEYYQEILERTRLDPADCVMVGNDVEEDLVAGDLGMRTFLVEGYVIDRGSARKPDARGALEDLPLYLEGLRGPGWGVRNQVKGAVT